MPARPRSEGRTRRTATATSDTLRPPTSCSIKPSLPLSPSSRGARHFRAGERPSTARICWAGVTSTRHSSTDRKLGCADAGSRFCPSGNRILVDCHRATTSPRAPTEGSRPPVAQLRQRGPPRPPPLLASRSISFLHPAPRTFSSSGSSGQRARAARRARRPPGGETLCPALRHRRIGVHSRPAGPKIGGLRPRNLAIAGANAGLAATPPATTKVGRRMF